MLKLDWSTINSILSDTENKNIDCHMDKKLLLEWSYCSTNYFNYCLENCSKYEVAQIISSQDNYLKKKNTRANSVKYQKRQIIMVELGENYNNLSYKHPCIVMDSIDDKVFIVPCTSGQAPRNKNNNIYSGYIEADVCDGFSHLTTAILKEARCIDKTQIAYPIKDSNSTYKKVEEEFFKKLNDELFKILFEGHAYKVNKQEEIIMSLELKKEILEKELENKIAEINSLEKEMDRLRSVAVAIEK